MFESIKNSVLSDVDIHLEKVELTSREIDKFVIPEIMSEFTTNISVSKLKELVLESSNFLSHHNYKIISKILNGDNYPHLIETGIGFIYFCKSKNYYIDPISFIGVLSKEDSDMIPLKVYGIIAYNTYNETSQMIDFNYYNELANILKCDVDEYVDNLMYSGDDEPSDGIEYDVFDYLNIEQKVYTRLTDTSYVSNKLLNDNSSINVLITNLSYDVYSVINLPLDLYKWNIDNREFMIGDILKNDFLEIYKDIAANGINTPILLNIDKGIMYPPITKDAIILFIAKLWKIPSIPAILYTSRKHINLYMEYFKSFGMERQLASFMELKNVIEPNMLLVPSDNQHSHVFTPNGKYYLPNYELMTDDNNYINFDGFEEYDLYCRDTTKTIEDPFDNPSDKFQLDDNEIDNIMKDILGI